MYTTQLIFKISKDITSSHEAPKVTFLSKGENK